MRIELKTLAWKIERRWMLLPWRWAASWIIQGIGASICFFGGVLMQLNALAGILAFVAGLMFFLTGWSCRNAELD